MLFKRYIKIADNNFFHFEFRKSRLESRGFAKRNITTAFGDVTFERTSRPKRFLRKRLEAEALYHNFFENLEKTGK